MKEATAAGVGRALTGLAFELGTWICGLRAIRMPRKQTRAANASSSIGSGVLSIPPEVNGRLVGPLVFKTSGTGDPRPVGSIPATSAPRPPRRLPVKKFLILMIVVALGAVVAKKKLAA
jgi:hypothetical protein